MYDGHLHCFSFFEQNLSARMLLPVDEGFAPLCRLALAVRVGLPLLVCYSSNTTTIIYYNLLLLALLVPLLRLLLLLLPKCNCPGIPQLSAQAVAVAINARGAMAKGPRSSTQTGYMYSPKIALHGYLDSLRYGSRFSIAPGSVILGLQHVLTRECRRLLSRLSRKKGAYTTPQNVPIVSIGIPSRSVTSFLGFRVSVLRNPPCRLRSLQHCERRQLRLAVLSG